jgi:hypothetical protein
LDLQVSGRGPDKAAGGMGLLDLEAMGIELRPTLNGVPSGNWSG